LLSLQAIVFSLMHLGLHRDATMPLAKAYQTEGCYPMEKESKAERFVRVAEKRVQNVLNSIRSLSQLANKKVYQWDDAQLKAVFDAIETEMAHCKKNFEDPNARIFKFK